MNLTAAHNQDYSNCAPAKSGVRIGLLCDRGDEPQPLCSAAFLLSGIALNGRTGQGAARLAGAIPVVQPVQFRPPRLDSWQAVRLTNWRSHIMTNKSKVASATSKNLSRKKSKSAAPGNVIHLTREMRVEKALNDFLHFMDTASEAEKNVVRHLKIGIGAEALMREIRRLLGEPVPQCRVIKFPSIDKSAGA